MSSVQIVAVVVKFADNVMKVFATSLSILLSSFVSWRVMKDFDLTATFLTGSAIVLASVTLFSLSGGSAGSTATSRKILPT
jgi:UDP-sugar transporter A1/2/3